jgi:hypothetical protein
LVNSDAKPKTDEAMETTSALMRTFFMGEEVWLRHANPLSVYTRFLSMPLLALALWSRDWIGLWCFVPVALAIFWIWINPRIFPRPSSTDNWASKAVLGERTWLRRKAIPIPRHHATAALLLATVSGIGALQFLYGAIALEATMLSYGLCVTLLGKAWFLDRMVWLYEDMMHTNADYRDWLY